MNPSSIDQCSIAAVPIKAYFGETKIEGHASGFLWRHPSKGLHLISNWHVFSHMRADNQRNICPLGARPNRLMITIQCHEKSRTHDSMREVTLDVPLVDGEGYPLWKEHPVHASSIDVAALPLDAAITQTFSVFPVNELNLTDQLATYVGGDAYVVGYPFDPAETKNLPVWKKGSIATEPAEPINDLPLIWIDTPAKPGMSGSAVYLRAIGQGLGPRGEKLDIHDGIISQFLGVYSGRRANEGDEFNKQIGLVRNPSVILEIVAGSSKPNIPSVLSS